MNRRGFIAGMAALAPLIFLPKIEPVRWKRSPAGLWQFETRVYHFNPEWTTAKYEICFVGAGPWPMERCQTSGEEYFRLPPHYLPMRGNEIGADGKLVAIWPFVTQ